MELFESLFDNAHATGRVPFEVSNDKWLHEVRIDNIEVKKGIAPTKLSENAFRVYMLDGKVNDLKKDSEEFSKLTYEEVSPQYRTATLLITLVKEEDGVEKSVTLALREAAISSTNIDKNFVATATGKKQYDITFNNLRNKLLHILCAVSGVDKEDEVKIIANKAMTSYLTEDSKAIVSELKYKNYFVIEAIGEAISKYWKENKEKTYFTKLVRQGGNNEKYCNNIQFPDNFTNFFCTANRKNLIVKDARDKFDVIKVVEQVALQEPIVSNNKSNW